MSIPTAGPALEAAHAASTVSRDRRIVVGAEGVIQDAVHRTVRPRLKLPLDQWALVTDQIMAVQEVDYFL
jgi:hypothetical protein